MREGRLVEPDGEIPEDVAARIDLARPHDRSVRQAIQEPRDIDKVLVSGRAPI